MKTLFSLAALALSAGAVATPASAASTVTELFMANVKANVAFLDGSSKLASTHSRSAVVRKLAASEIAEATHTASLLDHVAPATRVAAASTGTDDAMLTGRSAATTAPIGQAANGRAALGADDVASLDRLQGKRFDDALWLKQLDALSQLRADYETYAASGDDAVLRSVAKAELPRVEARLLALSKI